MDLIQLKSQFRQHFVQFVAGLAVALLTSASASAAGLGVANLAPSIAAPPTVSASKNTPVSINGSAFDPDGQNVTLSQTNNASFLSGPASAGPSPNPSITLSGTANQTGSHTVNWSANDGAGGTAAATTTLTITNNRHPDITSPGIVNGTETTAVSITASASDPDAQTVTLSQTNNAAFLAGPASAGPVLNPSITLNGTPNFSQSGNYSVNWNANDGAGGTWATTTNISIANLNRAPVITAPATVSGTENTAVSITASASDPDVENVTLSQTNNAGFLAGPSSVGPLLNPSLTLTGTPNLNQSGSYTVSWTANGIGTAAATTALTIANLNQNPAVTAPATVSGTENSAVSITGSASDPDAQNVTLSQTNDAAFLTGAASAGPSANPSITLTGTPDFNQSGSYAVNWSANDGAGGTAAATTALTISNLNRATVITAPGTVFGTETAAISITASASDPDAQAVTLSQTNTVPFLSGPASAGPALNPSITLTGTPTFTQGGQYVVYWSATDGVSGTVSRQTVLLIANMDQSPVITAPATASGSENSPVSITGSASDPDGDNVMLSETSDAAFLFAMPAGTASNPSITLIGTPNLSQSGSYTVNWSANDGALTTTATTALTIANVNGNPAIAAPASVSGTESSAVSVTGSATDPDAENVTLSQTNDAAFLAGPTSAGPLANPSITLTGTPNSNQSGSYTVNWSANDGAGGTATATTALTIGDLERNPVITAPGTVFGTETAAISITASASDPDAQAVTLSQTNSAPFLSGAASAGPALNPSITLTGTPTFTQGGQYVVYWSATDGVSGTVSRQTVLLIANMDQSPVITAPGTVSGSVLTAVSITGSASDPDGDGVTLFETTNAPFLPSGLGAGPLLHPSITLTGTPNLGQAGSYAVIWNSHDNALTSTATTAITIANVNGNPAITAPATVSGTENTAVSITGSASDPDAQNVTLSQTNNAAFLAGPASAGPVANPSLTLTGTPAFGQAGSYAVNWSADDGAGGTATAATAITIASTITAVDSPAPATPRLALRQNQPNPFNPRTTIRYSLPRAGRAQLRVFDVHGKLVAILRDDVEPAGEQSVEWDGRNREGQPVASGVYLYRLTTEFGADRSKWMVILK